MITSLILRSCPDWADKFLLEQVESESGMNTYSYEKSGDKVLIKGDCAISMAVAFCGFVRDYCGGYFDAEHALRTAQFNLPSEKKEGTIEKKYRTCFEYTSFSCGACWWDWERWQNEIDFMAMNGVNMPLAAVGTEAVWRKTLTDMGMKEELALACISGPAFWGWQLSDCFDGYLPQTNSKTVDKRIELGRKIIEREKELGMMPILHGFSGYVSRNFIEAKFRARLHKTDEWCLFPPQYMLSFKDSTFHRIGNLYYHNLKLLLGESCYYMVNPFDAHAPAKDKPSFLAGFGSAVSGLIFAQGDSARWVIRSSSFKPDMLKTIPKERLLVIDDGSMCDELAAAGYEVVVGNSYNQGNVNAVHGDIDFVTKENNASGVGTFSDGAYSNEAYRQLSYAALCGERDADEFLKTYAKNRYATEDSTAYEALKLLKNACWKSGMKREHLSAVCARPSLDLTHTTVGDRGTDFGYDAAEVFAAAKKLVASSGKTYEFELDVCDVLRQALSDLSYGIYKKAVDGYRNKDAAAFEENSNLFLTLIEDLDRLMLTKKEFSLPHYLGLAASCGGNAEESQNFEVNVLVQSTFFGPHKDSMLYDICCKEWGGILTSFYAKRWRAFFEQLAFGFKRSDAIFKTKKSPLGRDLYLGSEFGRKLAPIERDWIATYMPETELVGKESTLDVAKELIAKYTPNF